MSDSLKTTFHNETFEKTSQNRRQTLIDTAINEFATKGFNGTNVNVIAKKAGISIGVIYKYFPSKEDLFLSIVSHQREVLGNIMTELGEAKGFQEQIRRLFEFSGDYGTKYAKLSQIYLNLTTQPLAELAGKLSEDMEKSMVDYLINIIRQGKDNHEVREDVDEAVTAFCIDNLMVMYQLAHSSTYFRNRLELYVGKDRAANTKDLLEPILEFIWGQSLILAD